MEKAQGNEWNNGGRAMFFQELAEILQRTKTDCHLIVRTKDDPEQDGNGQEREIVLAIHFKGRENGKKCELAPLIIRGNARSLDEDLPSQLRDATEKVAANLSLVEQLDEQNRQLQQKAAKSTKRKPDRKSDPQDLDAVKTLATVPATDANFKAALGKASLETLKAAYEKCKTITAAKAIEAEIKKLAGKTLEELGLTRKMQATMFDVTQQLSQNGEKQED